MNINGQLSHCPLDIANAFNTHCTAVAENLLNKNSTKAGPTCNNDPLLYLRHKTILFSSSMTLKHTTTHEINKIILLLENKNSHGYDEISSKILKASAAYIPSPLTYIFNKVLRTGIFLDRLKFAEIKPLFKKGKITEVSNYRPISLLLSFSKIIEKIIHTRLYKYLTGNNLLAEEQFGFREKANTEIATQTLLNNILTSLDKRSLGGGLFCDLQKAFDCVNHKILFEKMKLYGITGTAHVLMQSYLMKRYQRTLIRDSNLNKITCSWEPTGQGVPQGSILSPLLFLIYINDLPLNINTRAHSILYADDTSIIITDTTQESFKDNINLTIKEITNWFHSNLLTLNCDKTYFVQFLTKKQKEIKLQIVTSNSIITNINSTKFLGLIIDSTLSWKEHITELTSKLNKACYAIRTLKASISPEVLRMIYFSYFHTIMTYGIIFWGNSSTSINIFRIQNRILRIMTNTNRWEL